MRTPFIQLTPVLAERMEKAFRAIEEDAGDTIKATRPNHVGNFMFDFAGVPFGVCIDLLQQLKSDDDILSDEAIDDFRLIQLIQSKLIMSLV